MRLPALIAAAFLLAIPARSWSSPKKPAAPAAQKPAPARDPAALSPDEKAVYSIGLAVARSLDPYALSPAELELVIGGLRDGLSASSPLKLDAAAQENLKRFMDARTGALAEQERSRGAAYLEKAAQEKGALKTASGVVVVPLREGAGATPQATDTVAAHYVGTRVDGKRFDASRDHGEEPVKFPVNQVIPCWTEALQQMKVGGEAKVVCPAETAYGEKGSPPAIPANAVLTFDIELVDIVK